MIRSIPDIRVADQATRDALEAMKEIIEVMLGRRGSDPDDHVLTRGDSSTIVGLFEALNTGLSHDTLADVSADDHHSETHTVVSHSDTTATGAELDELTDGSDTTLHDHDGITENTDARHAESHNIASHSDTTATGTELETLTDNSIADTLHRHSELVASDGDPDPALSVDADGLVSLANGTGINEFSTDGTLVGDSDDAVPTEKAVRTFAGAYAITVDITDISTAGSVWVVAPYAGDIAKIYSVINGVITDVDATITAEIGGTLVTDSSITIANVGSAAGVVDSSTPSAANTVTAGQAIEIISDGGSTGVCRATVTIAIAR